MPQHITVVEYSPQWPLKYEREKEKIMAILKWKRFVLKKEDELTERVI